MESQPTPPVLLSKARSKYGPQDYTRYDHITSSHMRAGRGSIGKVEVDCRFLFKQSHWGVIGEAKHPAGILFMDLDLRQPPDCKLQSATVTVTLEENDGVEANIERRSRCPVKFTTYYGPQSLRGEQSHEQTKTAKKCTPEVQVMGYGVGGLGVDKEKIVQTASRWAFSGHMGSSKGNMWYNQLRWELKENPLERQPTHSHLIHTAFALEHNATRFYMTVHVSGKLTRLSDKLRGRLKFRSKEEEHQDIVTKIEWRDGYASAVRLDAIAQDLDPAMQLQNMSRVSIEVPSALPATFHPAITNPASLALQQPSLTPWSGPGRQEIPDREPLRIAGVQTPTLQDLRTAAGLAPSQLPCRPQPSATPQQQDADEASECSSSGSETLVNSAATTPLHENTSQPARKNWTNDSDLRDQSDSKSQGVVAGLGAVGHVFGWLLQWLGMNLGLLLLWLCAPDGGTVQVITESKRGSTSGGNPPTVVLAADEEDECPEWGFRRGAGGEKTESQIQQLLEVERESSGLCRELVEVGRLGQQEESRDVN